MWCFATVKNCRCRPIRNNLWDVLFRSQIGLLSADLFYQIFFDPFSVLQPRNWFNSWTSLASFIKNSDWSFHTSVDLHFSVPFSPYVTRLSPSRRHSLPDVKLYPSIYFNLSYIFVFSPIPRLSHLNVANIDTKSSYLKARNLTEILGAPICWIIFHDSINFTPQCRSYYS